MTNTLLFDDGVYVASGRVQLSQLALAHIEAMPWLEAALAPEWTPQDLRQALEANAGVLVSDPGSVPIGVALVQLDTPLPGCVSLPFLAIDPQRRFRGLGGEAGLAIERHLRARLGSRRFFAPIPDWRGLAVYFWLRLGYRPLLKSEQPLPLAGLSSPPPDGIWMTRDIE